MLGLLPGIQIPPGKRRKKIQCQSTAIVADLREQECIEMCGKCRHYRRRTNADQRATFTTACRKIGNACRTCKRAGDDESAITWRRKETTGYIAKQSSFRVLNASNEVHNTLAGYQATVSAVPHRDVCQAGPAAPTSLLDDFAQLHRSRSEKY